MSIRASMYRMVFSLIAVPFLIFSLIITYICSTRLENAFTESLRVVANAQVSEMNDFCEQQKDYLTMIGTMDISRAAMKGELDGDMLMYLNNILYSRVEAMDYLNSFVLIDKDNRIAACSEEHGEYADEGINGLIDNMGERQFLISDVLPDSRDHKTLVAISRIQDEGETLGYALMEINLDFYENIRKRAELWNDSTFYPLDGKQQIISAGTPDENRNSFVTSANERKDYLKKYSQIDFENNPQGCFQYKVGGQKYITYYSNIEFTDWRVMLSVNLDNYQPRSTVYYILVFFLISLCSVIAVWIGSFASRRIIHPVKCISDTLKKIQQTQDYSLRIASDRRDELGNLTEEINGLIDYIETENLYKAQQQRLLQQKAEQDALTRVLNKERSGQYLQEALERCSASGLSMAVLFVDIDDFRLFNNNYGHNIGDQVLRFISSLLTRETGGTVGRIGGDEFLVIMENQEKIRSLDECLTEIEKNASTQFRMRNSCCSLSVSCCIGAVRIDFSAMGTNDLSAEELLHIADIAMYHVKKNGKRGHYIQEYPEL